MRDVLLVAIGLTATSTVFGNPAVTERSKVTVRVRFCISAAYRLLNGKGSSPASRSRTRSAISS